MIILCDNCSTRFLLNPSLIGPNGRMVKCAKCNNVWRQTIPSDYEEGLLEQSHHPTQAGSAAHLPSKISKFAFLTQMPFMMCVVAFTFMMFVANLFSGSMPAVISEAFGMYDTQGIIIAGIDFKAVGNKFVIRGSVKNISQEAKKMPWFKVTLLDKEGAQVAKVLIPLDEEGILPKDGIYKFSKRFEPMPYSAKKVIVDIGSKADINLRW